jgi:OHCU decarboxylase
MWLASSWCRWGLSDKLAWFNSLPRGEAELHLLVCCGSRAWAAAVAAGRPYANLPSLVKAADAVWNQLAPSDWLEAFAAHPRIGESGGHSPDRSEKEQSRIMGGADDALAAVAEENRAYEARFGHVFLISAAGRSALEVLAALRLRMHNDPATEIKVAAEEQRKITRLRLDAMLNG